MTGLGRLGRRISRPVLAGAAGAAVAILPAACGGTGTHPIAAKPEVSGPLHGWTPPQPEALSPLGDYKAEEPSTTSSTATETSPPKER